MAKSFGKTNGKAKSGANYYKHKDGENRVRLIGGIVPRYAYFLKDKENKSFTMECLAFNREEERFDRVERDVVREHFPDEKCGWSYVSLCIDPDDGEIKVFPHKKGLYEEIQNAAEDLGDPTDPETGWELVYKRSKTGPLAFNVAYSLQVLRCKTKALTDEEKAKIAESPDIDELMPRPTPEDQEKIMQERVLGNPNVDEDDLPEGDDGEDVPF